MQKILAKIQRHRLMSRIGGMFFAFIALIMLYTSSAIAAGYTCNTKVYVSCNSGYYLSGYGSSISTLTCSNGTEGGITESPQCLQCPSGCTCAGGTKCPSCGYKITLDMQSGSGGTAAIYQHTNGSFYLDDTYTKQMTTSANGITVPTRAGYVFGGYYTAVSGGGALVINSSGNIVSGPPTFSAATTLYAKWSACTAGYYCPAGSTSVTQNPCAAGTYSQAGWASCQSVDAGCWGAAKATTSCPNECEAGKYSTGGADSCIECGAGKWSNKKANSCSEIKAGCYGTNGASECPNTCDAGTYSLKGQASCTDCPAGTYGATTGLTTEACSGPCEAGYYCPKKSTSKRQKDCSAGNYCPAGSGSETDCGGDLTSDKNAKDLSECFLTCNAGTYLPKSGKSCSTCTVNNYCTGTHGNLHYSTTTDQGITSCPAGSSLAGAKVESDCKLTITLNKNGGSGTCADTVTCSYNTDCTLPQWNSSSCNLTNSNKIFKNWGDSASATSGVTKKKITASTTVYAVWADTVCTVTKGTGTPTTPTNNSPRCKVTCEAGYQKSDTYTGTAGDNTFSYECTVITFNVSYAGGDGTGAAPTSPKSCTYGSTCNAPTNRYTRTGYDFNGWQCTGGNSSCDGDIVAAGASINTMADANGATITLTATWKEKEYTITLNRGNQNDGTATLYGRYNKGVYTDSGRTTSFSGATKITPPSNPTGYTFNGYFTDQNGKGKQKINKDGTRHTDWKDTDYYNDVTLYAFYKPNKVGCAAGKYLPANTPVCANCDPGYYCEAWGLDDKGQPNTDYDGQKHGNIYQCPTLTTSDAGAATKYDCYASGNTPFTATGASNIKITGIKSFIYQKK